MFAKVKKSIESFWTNPYAKPVTMAVDGILHYARAPIRKFIDGVKKAADDEEYRYDSTWRNRGFMARLFHESEDYSDGFGIIAIGGAIVGTIAFGGLGALAGVAMMGGLAGQITAAAVLGLAFCGVGAVAGPFIVAGVFATVGAMVGLGIGMVPGFFKGCAATIKHIKEGKTQESVAKSLPPKQAEDAELVKNIAKVMQEFNSLPKEHRAPLVRMMNEKHQDSAPRTQAEKTLAAIDTMPEQERAALIRALRDRLSDDFTVVAEKDAKDSVTLQTPVTSGGVIRLKQGA